MYKLISLLFGSSLITMSILALLAPASELSILMDTAMPSAIIRMSFAFLLIAYSLAPLIRYDFFRDVLLFLSTVGVGFLGVSIFADNFPFPKPLDMFFILYGATLSAIAATDFKRPKSVQKFLPHITMVELFVARLRKIELPFPRTSSPATRETKTA